MPTGVALDVDPEAKEGTVPPTNEEGRKKRTPINSAPEEVKKGKKLESNSSKNTIRGAASKKTSNRLNDGPDTDFASTSPKKNDGVQMAPSDRKQKDDNRRDNRYGYRASYDNNQGGSNYQGRRQRRKKKKKKDEVPVTTYDMDDDFGSEYESDHDPNNDRDLEEAQAGVTFGKKRCQFNELKSAEEGKEKGVAEGEDKDGSKIHSGIGAEKISCPNKDFLSLIPMAHQLSLNADSDGTSTLPKSSLAIKEELMQEKGLILKKTVNPTVDHAKPSAKNRESSKSSSVPTGSNESNPGLNPKLSNATMIKLANLKKRKDEKSAKKKGAQPKSTGIVDSSSAIPNSRKTKLQKIGAKGSPGTNQSSKVDGKAITFKATEDAALSSAKRASPIKTIGTVLDNPAGSKKQKKSSQVKTIETGIPHPADSKKQKKSSTDDAVEAKGIADGTHQSSKIDGKAMALNAIEGHALSSAKSASANAKGPLGSHQSRKVGGKVIALKANEDAVIIAAKRASPLKTIEKGADHPAGSKKQQKSPSNDVVETKGISDSFSVPTTLTKSKKAITVPNGPIVTQQSGKTGGKAIASKANAEKIHDEGEDNPNRIEHVPGENH